MTDDVIFTQERQLGVVTLNRPPSLNALSLPMILAMQEQLSAWESDDTIKAVVIKSASDKAFCAGGDVRWLYEMGKKEDPRQMDFFWHEYRLNHFIHHFKKPYVALMDGMTMGGGVGISLHGSHPIASENFTFAMPETSIGFFPDIGASYLLAQCLGDYGVYLGLTGSLITAADAYALGLVRSIVPSNQFESLFNELVDTKYGDNPFDRVSTCINNYAQNETAAPIMQCQTNIQEVFHQASMEAILSSLQATNTAWHADTFKILQQKSPLSLKITLEQLRRAKTLNVTECIQMDYCLVQHFMRDHDFYEGVRALLIDKDKSPQWQPQTLESITSYRILQYFECLSEELQFIN